MNSAFRVFADQQPEAPPRVDAVPTLWKAINLYLEHLALRVQAGEFDRDNYVNVSAALRRFASAWSVIFTDGRHFLVPQAEPQRRVPLEYGAADEAEAIAQANRLAGLVGAGLVGAMRPKTAEAALAVPNGHRPLADCSNDDLMRWTLANPQWVSGCTKHNNLTAIVNCLHWFEDERGHKSPLKRRRLPKFIRPSRREADNTEYVALMRRGSRPLRRILWTLYNVQGIRTSEMRSMRWSHVDLEAGVVRVKNKTRRATGEQWRLVPLTARQLRVFRAFRRNGKLCFSKLMPEGRSRVRAREEWAEDDFVFLNCSAKPWTRRSLCLHFARTRERAGLFVKGKDNVTAYCFRHSFSTQSDEAGADEAKTVMLMGHKSPRMHRTNYSKAGRKARHMVAIAEEAQTLRRRHRKAVQPPTPPAKPEDAPLFDGLD